MQDEVLQTDEAQCHGFILQTYWENIEHPLGSGKVSLARLKYVQHVDKHHPVWKAVHHAIVETVAKLHVLDHIRLYDRVQTYGTDR